MPHSELSVCPMALCKSDTFRLQATSVVLVDERHLLTVIFTWERMLASLLRVLGKQLGEPGLAALLSCKVLSLALADDTFPIDKHVVFCPKSLPLCKRAFLHLPLPCLGLLLSKRNSVGPRL